MLTAFLLSAGGSAASGGDFELGTVTFLLECSFVPIGIHFFIANNYYIAFKRYSESTENAIIEDAHVYINRRGRGPVTKESRRARDDWSWLPNVCKVLGEVTVWERFVGKSIRFQQSKFSSDAGAESTTEATGQVVMAKVQETSVGRLNVGHYHDMYTIKSMLDGDDANLLLS